jgi:hypothetical protein
MNELLKSVDRVASLVPMDGNKTLIILTLKAFLPVLAGFIPGFQPIAASALVNALIDIGLAVGVGHKAVKGLVRKEEKK